METNPYEYDRTIPWIPQQNQLYEGRYVTERASQQRPPVLQDQRPQQRRVDQKPKPPERMPKARALALARTLKKGLVIASLLSFGAFSGLVAYHQVGTTTTANTSSGSSQATPASTSSSQNSNGFFNQQGGNNFGSSNSSQGSSSGSSVS
jgi:hypothetical protein